MSMQNLSFGLEKASYPGTLFVWQTENHTEAVFLSKLSSFNTHELHPSRLSTQENPSGTLLC